MKGLDYVHVTFVVDIEVSNSTEVDYFSLPILICGYKKFCCAVDIQFTKLDRKKGQVTEFYYNMVTSSGNIIK